MESPPGGVVTRRIAGGMEMRNYMRSFFSKARAVEFTEHLEAVGAEDIQITMATDAFGQVQYRVEWNED